MDALNKGGINTALARAAIAAKLDMTVEVPETRGAEWLQKQAASFVTLTMYGQLRGCIGSLEAYRPLIEDVECNALAAAFNDPRFDPLSKLEYASVQVEVSVLGELEAIHAKNENIARSKIRPGIDGVVFKYGAYKATFLPQVWEQLPTADQFMAHLKQKAGLGADFWHPEVLLYKYQVNKYREQERSKE